MKIRIKYAEVVRRQIELGVFDSNLQKATAVAVSYWKSQVYEEVDEYLKNPSAEELADVLIFLQNLFFCVHPEQKEFLIDFENPVIGFEPRTLTELCWNRKHWKVYSKTDFRLFENWFLILFQNNSDISQVSFIEAYEAKQLKNKTRKDWNLRNAIS